MLRLLAINLAAFGGFMLLLFVPAGTLAWPQGWAFLLLFFGCSQAMGVWLMRVDPALLKERMRSPLRGGQSSRDRIIMVAIEVSFIAWLVFMPLDARRFGWSHVPVWLQALGAVLVVIAFWGWSRVLKANSFASTAILIQPERGQTVISTGPYAVVRHPMYADTYFLFVGAPLLLGSFWGLLAVVLFTPLMALRALGEEAVLMDGLPGYREYAAKVRYRLIPGVW